MKLELTRKGFVEWLRQNQDLEFERKACDACPIAVFLGGTCDHDVNVETGEIVVDGETFGTPVWAERFIEAVDSHYGQITGKEALSLFPAHVTRI